MPSIASALFAVRCGHRSNSLTRVLAGLRQLLRSGIPLAAPKLRPWSVHPGPLERGLPVLRSPSAWHSSQRPASSATVSLQWRAQVSPTSALRSGLPSLTSGRLNSRCLRLGLAMLVRPPIGLPAGGAVDAGARSDPVLPGRLQLRALSQSAVIPMRKRDCPKPCCRTITTLQ